jgi:hypothetical protein
VRVGAHPGRRHGYPWKEVTGLHLVQTLKLLVRMKVLDEGQIVAGDVTVTQFISRPDHHDVDAGSLVTLQGKAMSGRLGKH